MSSEYSSASGCVHAAGAGACTKPAWRIVRPLPCLRVADGAGGWTPSGTMGRARSGRRWPMAAFDR
jgi:hypothetical protein